MSALPLTRPRSDTADGTVDVVAPAGRYKGGIPVALAVALLLLLLYAAFSHGATALGTSTRVEIAVAVFSIAAAGAWLLGRTVQIAAPPLAISGIVLLFGFAVWSAITLVWSVAPNQTWLELNRALTYVTVLGLGVAVGASDRRALEVIAIGFGVVVLAVTLYALGQKVLPGLHLDGIFTLNQTGPLPRLQEPFGYWNALALFIVLGVAPALALTVDARRARRVRVAAVLGLELMLLAIAFTYSRGGLIALAFVLLVAIACSGNALHALMWTGACAIALLPPLIFGLTSHSLTAADVSLSSRESDGVILLAVLLASLVTLAVAARTLFELESKVQLRPHQTVYIKRILAGALATLLVVGIVALAVSPRGLTGTVSHAWKSFTQTKATSVYEPTRLLSADSENRWVWWKEAAGAFSDRPITGWGAGSFPVVHLLYRRDNLSVSQPHSVPLQFLAETGVVGTLLALAGLAALLVAAGRLVRRLPRGGDRLLAAALLAGAVGYTVHALYDWDWDIPGVTLPACVFLGVLAGAAARDRVTRAVTVRGGAIVRLFGFGAIALYMCAFAASALLPDLAARKASAAVVAASSPSPTGLQRAEDAAKLATRIDPLSDAGLKVQATIATRRGQLQEARTDLLDATKRNPADGGAWEQLSAVEIGLGNSHAALQAVGRVLALDPRGTVSRVFAAIAIEQLKALRTPPTQSATAVPATQ